MSTEDAKAAVARLYAAYATRDPAAIGACLTDDAVWVAPAGNATQVALGLGKAEDAGPPRGLNDLSREQIVAFVVHDFRRLFAHGVRNELVRMVAEGDWVVTEARLSATLGNGRAYVNDYCFWHRVEGGRVAEIREFMDTRGGWVQVFGNDESGQLDL